ncbi:hypothetical protein ACGFIV_15285 [Sphaerisporangium sp. NPDC049003]|uniref:hypothetical protein n=1 Tax=Sphaerisporangium sp. NPDC049003 TaxID=3364517 RepID=UPI00371DEE07
MLADSKGRTPRAIADDQLLWLWRCFVHPAGFGRARTVLAEHGTVLMDGVPGSGRNTAAWMLLYELRSGTQAIRELLPEDEDSPRRLDTDRVGDGDLLLLDLSEIREQLWTDIQDELSSLRKAVLEHGARLVVVLPWHRIERVRTDLDRYRVEIGRPQGLEVVRRYLRVEGVPGAQIASQPKALSAFLDTNPSIRQIADFAGLIVGARTTSQGKGEFTEWCKSAGDAQTGLGTEVAHEVAVLREGPQRALLLATAMLQGSRAESIHRAGVSLLRAVKHPPEQHSLLEGADLAERFTKIKAEPDGSGRVRFTQFGYDAAVRAHFWKHMPELRDHLNVWVADAVDTAALDVRDRDTLVERFVEQCLRDGYPDMVSSSVSQWTREPTTNARLQAAAKALEAGLSHKDLGRFFRRQIYTWSQMRLPDRFGQVLVVLCFEVMAVRHPDEAVVRLHHLARRERGAPHAREALVRLIGDTPRLHRLMLDRLVYAFTGSTGREWQADVDLFLHVADPAPFTDVGTRGHAPIAEPVVRGQLIAGWNVVFQRRQHETWSRQVRKWLLTAADDERHRDLLLDVLVGGGGERTDVLSRLYVLARDVSHLMSGTPDERRRRALLVDVLRQKINTVLGIFAA